jgi:hypothetical protein
MVRIDSSLGYIVARLGVVASRPRISFIDGHTTIVNAGKDADNDKGNITTAVTGVSIHWSWLIRRARSARVMVVPCRPAFQANESFRSEVPSGNDGDGSTRANFPRESVAEAAHRRPG